MAVAPASAHELAQIASEIGAPVLEGDLRYPSETGGWQLGHLDRSEYLDPYRNQQFILIIAPVGPAPAPSCTCGISAFVHNERGECPRCKLDMEEVDGEEQSGGKPDVLHQCAWPVTSRTLNSTGARLTNCPGYWRRRDPGRGCMTSWQTRLFFKAAWEANAFDAKACWAQIENDSNLRMVSGYEKMLDTPGKCEGCI